MADPHLTGWRPRAPGIGWESGGIARAPAAAFDRLHVVEREVEGGEFVADCAECGAEIAQGKCTLAAELKGEEHILDRPRRWYRGRRSRDVSGAPSPQLAERRLKEYADVLDDFAVQVNETRPRP